MPSTVWSLIEGGRLFQELLLLDRDRRQTLMPTSAARKETAKGRIFCLLLILFYWIHMQMASLPTLLMTS